MRMGPVVLNPGFIYLFIYIYPLEHKRHGELASFLSSRGKISRSGIEPPTTPFDFGCLSTIMW